MRVKGLLICLKAAFATVSLADEICWVAYTMVKEARTDKLFGICTLYPLLFTLLHTSEGNGWVETLPKEALKQWKGRWWQVHYMLLVSGNPLNMTTTLIFRNWGSRAEELVFYVNVPPEDFLLRSRSLTMVDAGLTPQDHMPSKSKWGGSIWQLVTKSYNVLTSLTPMC